jgi:hypothetical protein
MRRDARLAPGQVHAYVIRLNAGEPFDFASPPAEVAPTICSLIKLYLRRYLAYPTPTGVPRKSDARRTALCAARLPTPLIPPDIEPRLVIEVAKVRPPPPTRSAAHCGAAQGTAPDRGLGRRFRLRRRCLRAAARLSRVGQRLWTALTSAIHASWQSRRRSARFSPSSHGYPPPTSAPSAALARSLYLRPSAHPDAGACVPCAPAPLAPSRRSASKRHVPCRSGPRRRRQPGRTAVGAV